jgi:hypothetical protein
VGQGELDNVPAGSSGFNNALLDSIPLALSGGAADIPAGARPRDASVGAPHLLRRRPHIRDGPALVRRSARGQRPRPDAGSRFDTTLDGANDDYYLRSGFALSKTAGSSRVFADVPVNSPLPCPARPFSPFGTWSISLP